MKFAGALVLLTVFTGCRSADLHYVEDVRILRRGGGNIGGREKRECKYHSKDNDKQRQNDSGIISHLHRESNQIEGNFLLIKLVNQWTARKLINNFCEILDE